MPNFVARTGYMTDHWWWRPGWQPGRRMYAWHITFAEASPIRTLAGSYQARLAHLPGLDIVPVKWLHLTTHGIGFTDDVRSVEIMAIVDRAHARIASLEAIHLTAGPARVAPEAIFLEISPADLLNVLRRELRAAISDILSPEDLREPEEWIPHVSLAYSNATMPAAKYIAAVSEIEESVDITIGAVQLIVLSRDLHTYEWTTQAEIHLVPIATT